MSYHAGGDSCLSIWGAAYGTGAIEFPLDAHVLEVGCAEADWQTPMLALRPDLRIAGIDWRGCKRPGVTIKGDVLTFDFPEASYDCVVGVSSIEHVGLGHYEADPKHIAGDHVTMQRVVRWLKPGGWAYLDVPFSPDGYQVHGTSHRSYDWEALEARLIPPGLRLERHWYANAGGQLVEHPDPRASLQYVALLLRRT